MDEFGYSLFSRSINSVTVSTTHEVLLKSLYLLILIPVFFLLPQSGALGQETTIYMEYPGVKGEVTATNYVDWIELNSADFSASSPVGSQSPIISDFSITKYAGSTSPFFLQKIVDQKSDGEVKIHYLNHTAGDGPRILSEITLYNVTLTELSHSGKNSIATEDLALNFERLKMKTYDYDPVTGALKGTPEFEYDFSE